MKAISIIGFSNSGKTSLMGLLADHFERAGVRVALVKHTHHQLDKPDTDTARLMKPNRLVLAMGTDETLLFQGMSRHLIDMLPTLGAELVLVEGGKSLGWLPRILCLREEDESTAPDRMARLVPELALACFGPFGLPGMPRFDESNIPALAQLILDKSFVLPGLDCGSCGFPLCEELARRIVSGLTSTNQCKAKGGSVEVSMNGVPLGLNPFTAGMLHGGIQGMLTALKGYTPGAEVTIRMK